MKVVDKWYNMFKNPETGLLSAADLLRFYQDHTKTVLTDE
jgi:hypothetical protein